MTATVPLTVTMGDGRALAFGVDARPAERAWFALGVRKSGSSVFSNIVSALAKANGINVVDLPAAMFDHGYRYSDWAGAPRIADLVWRGNAYVGFRDPPVALYGDPVFQGARKLLLVRDPRDALVSEYFSNAFSHSLPSQGGEESVIAEQRRVALAAELEEYVVSRAATLDRTVAGYRALLRDPGTLVMRYEEVIFDKARWIRDIAAHFGWTAEDALVGHILGWADVRPADEDPRRFVRRVAPGDAREKLSADALARIDAQLSDVWVQLGYEIGVTA